MPTPDFDFKDPVGNRVIPCLRDLQDFTCSLIAGVTTNLIAALPTNSTLTLSWGDVGNPNTNNPAIDLFAAADAGGGIGYLTNSTTASNQVDTLLCPIHWAAWSGQSIQLNSSSICQSVGRATHFIWCGVSIMAMDGLTLTIKDGNGNILGHKRLHTFKSMDIKQTVCERWTVGDLPAVAPTATARLAEDNLPSELPPIPFKYGDYPPITNTPYISAAFMDGTMRLGMRKMPFAESAFKRLYWQGYHGRFGSFQWPTDYGFNATLIDALLRAA